MSTATRLAWGILGAGNIARKFAEEMPSSRTGKLVAVGSRSRENAEAFARDFSATPHGSYDELLANPAVQAVYIATPHPQHVAWTVAAARAGKHILCEKPLTMNHAEAMMAAEAARQHDVFLMEAFMYRCHPQTAAIVDLVRSGRLGEVRLVDAVFGWDCGSELSDSRLFRPDLGGGAILDVGCYCASMARLIAGAVEGKPFAEPVSLKAVAHFAASGVDDYTQALLTFASGLQARLLTATRANVGASLTLTGSKATLRVPSPWFCGHPTCKLEIEEGGKVEVVEVKTELPIYSLEIDSVGDHVAQRESPAMPVADSLGNMATLDRWRQEIGLTYEMERMTATRPALPSLRKAPPRAIPHLHTSIPGIAPEKRASRMVLGTMLEGAGMPAPHGFALYDYFYEHGGTTFDTAYVYGNGLGEKTLGAWMQQRGVRDSVVVVVKGAHTPLCDPANFTRQFAESLDRLQTSYADVYLLHRDNPEIPAGEFVEAMSAEVRAGRLGIFGGSNWTLARIQEANDYARAHGLPGFGAVSNQFSLARMVNPVWGGCVSSKPREFRDWHRETGTPLFAWSSQARGFFVRGARDLLDDPEFVHSWYSDDNFERLERVRQLAHEKNVEPVNIAAAFVLRQSFPVFALIGPRTLAELASCFHAFAVDLSPAEMAWLDLET